MKVFQVNTIVGTTSTGVIVDNIAKAVREDGGEAFIAAARGASNVLPRKYVLNLGGFFNTIWHGAMTRLFDRHGMHSTMPTMSLIRAIDRTEPDVIHLHNLHGYYLNLPILFKYLKATNIPVVLTMHDCWMLTGHCAYPQVAKCCKFQNGHCNNCPQLNAYPTAWRDGSTRNIAMKQNLMDGFNNLYITTVSEWLTSVVNDSWLSGYPVFTIPNSVDTSVFKSCAPKLSQTLLAVANVWTDIKGYEDIVPLANALPEGWRLRVVGLSKRQCRELSAISNLDALGKLTAKELAKEYSAATATLNLSRAETCGMTILESLACGTRVISYPNTAPAMFAQSLNRMAANNQALLLTESETPHAILPLLSDEPYVIPSPIADYIATSTIPDYLTLYHNITGK